jgi:hypothetical protein
MIILNLILSTQKKNKKKTTITTKEKIQKNEIKIKRNNTIITYSSKE